MDNKSIIVLFGMLVAIFIVSFTLSIDAVAGQNVTYGIYAFVGFLLVVLASLFENMILSKEGVSISYWYRASAVIGLIVLVWYCTRLGTLFGWW